MSTALRVVLYGIIAAISPLALGATTAVLASRRARLNGLGFAIGVLAGQTLVFVLLALLGSEWIPESSTSHDALRIAVDLVLGGALLGAAWQELRTPLPRTPRPRPRTEALKARLQDIGPVTAVSSGVLLGIGGPKRLALALFAAAAIATADVGRVASTSLSVVYILLATVLVWVPVLVALVFADRTTDWLAAGQTWARAHERPLVIVPAVTLGAVLIGSGLLLLAGLV